MLMMLVLMHIQSLSGMRNLDIMYEKMSTDKTESVEYELKYAVMLLEFSTLCTMCTLNWKFVINVNV